MSNFSNNQGWIKLHRSIKDHWIWEDSNKLKYWLDLILSVNHESKQVLKGNSLIQCNRGQTITSLLKLANRWGIDRSSVRRYLNLLQKHSMIIIESNTKMTLITICNYDFYQDGRHTDEIAKQQGKKQSETQSLINKNEKKEKNEKQNYSQDFIKFWETYPKHIGKKAAWKAWQKANDKPDSESILNKVEQQKKQPNWLKDNGQYIPHPATYINQGRWEDEVNGIASDKPKFTM